MKINQHKMGWFPKGLPSSIRSCQRELQSPRCEQFRAVSVLEAALISQCGCVADGPHHIVIECGVRVKTITTVLQRQRRSQAQYCA